MRPLSRAIAGLDFGDAADRHVGGRWRSRLPNGRSSLSTYVHEFQRNCPQSGKATLKATATNSSILSFDLSRAVGRSIYGTHESRDGTFYGPKVLTASYIFLDLNATFG